MSSPEDSVLLQAEQITYNAHLSCQLLGFFIVYVGVALRLADTAFWWCHFRCTIVVFGNRMVCCLSAVTGSFYWTPGLRTSHRSFKRLISCWVTPTLVLQLMLRTPDLMYGYVCDTRQRILQKRCRGQRRLDLLFTDH